MRKYVVLFSLAMILTFVGCTSKETADSGKPIVYVSFYPIASMVETVAGDTVEVRQFVPKEADPHFWEPTARDMRGLANADVLFINGANMEKWADSVADNFPDLEIINLSEGVELITYKGAAAIGDFQYMSTINLEAGKTYTIDFGHTHENLMRMALVKYSGENDKNLIAKGKKVMEDKGKVVLQKDHIEIEDARVYAIEMGHEKGHVTYSVPESGEWVFVSDRLSENILTYYLNDDAGRPLKEEVVLEGSTSSLDKVTYDPHSWLSIVNAKVYYGTIYDYLVKAYPKHQRVYRKNKFAAVDELADMEYEFKDAFDDRIADEFITTHNAFGYIARDFSLVQFPLSDLVSTETPSMKTIRTALDFVHYYGVKTIFYEFGGDRKAAEGLVSEIEGGHIKPLISMEYTGNLDKLEMEDKSYNNIMRYNLEAIGEALRGQ